MNSCIKHFHSLVMWSELLSFAMIGEEQKDMALLSSQERTLLNKHYSKSMMDYFSLEGNWNAYLMSVITVFKQTFCQFPLGDCNHQYCRWLDRLSTLFPIQYEIWSWLCDEICLNWNYRMRCKKPVYKFWHLRVRVLITSSSSLLWFIIIIIISFLPCALPLCFFPLVRIPRPVSVKQLEHTEDEDGISDEHIKRNPAFQK